MKQPSLDQETVMRAAFLKALLRRVAHDIEGVITLPTGRVTTRELAHVLVAIKRAQEVTIHRNELTTSPAGKPVATARL